MEKTISTRQFAMVKRTAQNVQPLVAKKQKLQKQIASLIDEYKTTDSQIQGFEGGIKALCEGMGTEQLVKRVVTLIEGKFDKDGKQVKKTSYEPSPLVTFNPELNNYTIRIPEAAAPVENEEEKSAEESAEVEQEVANTSAE